VTGPGATANPVLDWTRSFCAICGVAAILGLAFVPEGLFASRLALGALAILAIAAAAGWLDLLSRKRPHQYLQIQVKEQSSRWWLGVTIGVSVAAALSVQTWFRTGTTIAGGDVVIPSGTAWLARVFEPWTWGGSTLGEPSQLTLALPWAVCLSIVHAFGANAELAQRAWYTTLYVGAGLAALGLFASLRLGPVAALTGSAVYLFNPYTLTWVNVNDNYIVALLLLTGIPAILVAAGTQRLSLRWSIVLLAASAPLIGYAFFNPPLVGIVLAATLTAPLLVAWVDGREAAFRTVRALLLAGPLVLAASAYWTVPAILHLSSIIPRHLLDLSWTWAENRATIRNGIWLNSHWGWPYPEYFPYAGAFDMPPLLLAKFALPAFAFGALVPASATQSRHQRFQRDRKLRLAVAAATVAILIILFSTGTNPPGNIIFVPLYNLPFGWLLREPGRFLIVAALAYSVLIALTMESLWNQQALKEFIRSPRLTVPALRSLAVPAALATAVLLGFPFYSGALVPDTRPTLADWAVSARPTHVQMPDYWADMARFTDSLPTRGGVLVMPPDDWYEMPYNWYYGTDDFVAQLFKRHILLPNAQGYTPASSQLIGAVNLTAQSILKRDWHQVQSLLTVLNTPLVLVRRDIEAPYANHFILPPADLADALSAAPNFALIRSAGPLELFALRGATVAEVEAPSNFMTINSQTPDLRILPQLPSNTALITSEHLAGVPNVVQAPPLETWPKADGQTMVWQPPAPVGSAYSIAELDSKTVVSLDRARTFVEPNSRARVVYAPDATANTLTVSVTGRPALSNGDFAQGAWGPIADCRNVQEAEARPGLGASVLADGAPGGLAALRVSASLDSGCESQTLDWQGGSIVMSLMVHNVLGTAPRICLWETGADRCAALPSLPETNGWSTYRASVSPDPRTTALTLYLYADAYALGRRTIDDYADVQITEVPALPSIALLPNLEYAPTFADRLVVIHNTFSSKWEGPTSSKHVLVDGMLNGWLLPKSSIFSAHYSAAGAFRSADWVSLASLLVILTLVGFGFVRRVARWRLGVRREGRKAADAGLGKTRGGL